MDIKKLRKNLNMTQEMFAFKLGMSVMTVKRWEKGDFKPSTLAKRQIAGLEKKVKK